MKRLCIYLTYDKQKVIDQYIGYILKELKTCTDYLAVVCNMPTIIRGKEILETYADTIFYRENIGFDAGGYKDALCHRIGWDKVLVFDELVLVNDSMFGPFRPMKNIFEEMDEKPVDFWGLSKHAEFRKGGFDYFPEHIQSFFFVFRSRILHSSHFRKYWEDMPYYTSYNEAVRKYEMRFTSWFLNLGYTYDILADTSVNDSDNSENNYTQFAKISYELIKKRNFPFLKKQQIADESLDMQTQENLRLAIDCIDRETDYDADLIWENIIRTLNMADLQRSLHLQYIVVPAATRRREDTLILVAASHESAVAYVVEYLRELGRNFDIKIAAYNSILKDVYQSQGFMCEELEQDEAKQDEARRMRQYPHVKWDKRIDLPYIDFQTIEGKKVPMYYPKDFRFTEMNGGYYVEGLMREQSTGSPHLYIKDDHHIKEGDCVIDAGVCEGNFALKYIDIVSHMYLFEMDPVWYEVLRYTFRNYENKVTIVNKAVSDKTTKNTCKIDDIVLNQKADFVKMDVEGAELDAIEGAKKTFCKNDIKSSICCYHRYQDENKIRQKLEGYGYHTTVSRGYMLFLESDDTWEIGDFRRGIVYGNR